MGFKGLGGRDWSPSDSGLGILEGILRRTGAILRLIEVMRTVGFKALGSGFRVINGLSFRFLGLAHRVQNSWLRGCGLRREGLGFRGVWGLGFWV